MLLQTIFFSSVLSSTYYGDLETLMFFNPQQGKVQSGVIESVERYGKPQISHDGDRLRINVGSFSAVQTLFALEGDGNLLGVVAYVREDLETIAILHIAVREEFSALGNHADMMLVMRLINKVREVAKRVKGVRSVTITYKDCGVRKISV